MKITKSLLPTDGDYRLVRGAVLSNEGKLLKERIVKISGTQIALEEMNPENRVLADEIIKSLLDELDFELKKGNPAYKKRVVGTKKNEF